MPPETSPRYGYGIIRLLLIAAAAASLGNGYGSPPQPRTGPLPPPPQVAIEQRLGSKVPLDLPFKDEAGHRVTLGECTANRPAILVLAYFRCPMLCTEVLNGVLAAVRQLPANAGKDFTIIVVSFDPREKPPLAALKKATYVQEYGRPGGDRGWRFLTGDPLAIATLTDAVGFHIEYDPATEQYAHASGIAFLAPDGTISRYLLGIKFPPSDVRLALAEASEGKVGSPADRVMLLCYRFDPATGRYTFSVLRTVRWVSGAAVLALCGLVGWLLVRGARSHRKEAKP